MTRKLILTPYEHGFIAGASYAFNNGPLADKDELIDLTHIFLSVVTMAGVDSIHSIGKVSDTKTTLVKKILPEKSAKQWSDCYTKVSSIFKPYEEKATNEKAKDDLRVLPKTMFSGVIFCD